ncbi:hypothetical protein F5972_00110 [Microbispora cellulosiformans]|uniref:Uncharacterized protein n=1 Tax=Microbispora cellulosiformans TaxID=2614688 RepID=A0A5J5K9H9_9ACTN|nr:hypothetical protein [Microbispora cellulosiformans]KAA9381305.1 hypothetical protein F5972_00110 [Microbispora cellulosiformans]
MTERMFAQLKPERLDELTEAAHRRRRTDDLAQAFRTPAAPSKRALLPGLSSALLSALLSARPPRRHPWMLGGVLAAGLAAGLAAALIVAPRVTPDSGPVAPSAAGKPGGTAHDIAAAPGTGAPTTDAPTSVVLDARTVLLAAAESASKVEAGTGHYWYTRDRTFSRLAVDDAAYVAKIRALAAERDRRAASGSRKAADRWFEEQLVEFKKHPELLPYVVFSGSTDESWRARQRGDANRNVRKSDGRLTFGSPEDERKWREAGAPRLVSGGEKSNEDRLDRVLSIDNPSLTIRNVDRLPADEEALERRLHELYQARPAGAANEEDFSVYLWQTAVDLLNAPITPGTRAALFRVLAGERGLTALGERADALGRTGAALAAKGPGDDGGSIEYRIIIDPDSARLLQYEVVGDGESTPNLRVALEEAGWVDDLRERP